MGRGSRTARGVLLGKQSVVRKPDPFSSDILLAIEDKEGLTVSEIAKLLKAGSTLPSDDKTVFFAGLKRSDVYRKCMLAIERSDSTWDYSSPEERKLLSSKFAEGLYEFFQTGEPAFYDRPLYTDDEFFGRIKVFDYIREKTATELATDFKSIQKINFDQIFFSDLQNIFAQTLASEDGSSLDATLMHNSLESQMEEYPDLFKDFSLSEKLWEKSSFESAVAREIKSYMVKNSQENPSAYLRVATQASRQRLKDVFLSQLVMIATASNTTEPNKDWDTDRIKASFKESRVETFKRFEPLFETEDDFKATFHPIRNTTPEGFLKLLNTVSDTYVRYEEYKRKGGSSLADVMRDVFLLSD